MSKVKLQSADDEIIEVELKYLQYSDTIKTLLRGTVGEVLPLPEVGSVILRRILKWAQYHANKNEVELTNEIPYWDKVFLKANLDAGKHTTAFCYRYFKVFFRSYKSHWWNYQIELFCTVVGVNVWVENVMCFLAIAGTFFELCSAADYLEIKKLSDISAMYFSEMVGGKSPEDIRRMFNIQNDFPPDRD